MPDPPSDGMFKPPFIELQSVDSTNNYARNLIREGMAYHGLTIFSHDQLAGKGQRGKKWISEKGSNILLSILLKPSLLRLEQSFRLNACIASAVHEFFSYYAGEETKIKWPNDLYWQDRKAGGILIESVIGHTEKETGGPDPEKPESPAESKWKWVIAGVGININQTSFGPGTINPVSLKQITGKTFHPLELAKELSKTTLKWYDRLATGDWETIYENYLQHLYKKGQKVTLKKGSRVFEAIIKSVTEQGLLIIQTPIEEEFGSGEIEWIIN